MGLLLACNPDKEVKSKYMSSDELQKILKEIWKSDQSYRILAGQMRQANNGVRTPSEADLWKKQTVIDSVNMNKVESIISSIGYPTKAMVGDSLKHVVAYIIMHNPKRQAKYVDLVWNAARNGDIKLLEAATLEDRVLMFSGRNQKFGTQMKYDTISTDHSTGNIVTKLRIWPIENPKIVDSLRNLIGLYPLSRQCELMNLDCGTIKGYK
jgi:hypothetical protein